MTASHTGQRVAELHPIVEGMLDTVDLLADLVALAYDDDGVARRGPSNCLVDGGGTGLGLAVAEAVLGCTS